MDEKTLECLEYKEVLKHLQTFVTSELGRREAERLRPFSDPQEVKEALEETLQMKAFLEEKGGVPVGGFPDIGEILERAERGGLLEPHELRAVADSIKASRILKDALSDLGERFYKIAALGRRLKAPMGLLREIEGAISAGGEVKDDASLKLRSLRAEIARVRKAVLSSLKGWVEEGLKAGLLQTDIITERNGRFVVLLRSLSKGRAKGIVHGASGSGASLYFEPLEIVDLNNELGLLREREGEEVMRILRRLSLLVAEHVRELQQDLRIQAKVDLLYGKARLAIDLGANMPSLSNEGGIRLLQARHPILEKRGREVVPVDILMGPQDRILIVSGANAGGKTVVLKTLGLLTLMAQSGMLIPASPDSSIMVFRRIFAHIGDEQDLSEDLSTFSSFVTWINRVLPQVDPQALVLIDEMGSGTDQIQGAALAMAIMDMIRSRGGYALVTTHLDPLKLYGFRTPGVRNASVEFDPQTMTPTYRLLYDLSGRSWTFSIARKWGTPEEVLRIAEGHERQLQGADRRILEELSELRESYLKELETAKKVRQEAERERKRLRELWEGLKAKRREILRRIEERGKRRLTELEEKLREIGRELRPQEISKAKAELKKLREQWRRFVPPQRLQGPSLEEVREGDWVRIKPFGAQGRVLEVSGERVQVAVGGLKISVHRSELAPAHGQKDETQGQVVVESSTFGAPEVNVRGMRVEEALRRVDKLIDEALIKGWDQVEIIHGIGTGALRRAIRDYLRGMPYVKEVRAAPQDRGGEGVTVVELR